MRIRIRENITRESINTYVKWVLDRTDDEIDFESWWQFDHNDNPHGQEIVKTRGKYHGSCGSGYTDEFDTFEKADEALDKLFRRC